MPRFRSLKQSVRAWFSRDDWSKDQPLPPECADIAPVTMVQPLFACLTGGGLMMDRAAYALGGVMDSLYKASPEDAPSSEIVSMVMSFSPKLITLPFMVLPL